MLSRVVKHIEFRRRQTRYPNLINSHAWHPEMIDPTAHVANATLSGPIRIAEHVKIVGPVGIDGHVTIGRYTALNGPNTDVLSDIHPIEIGAFCSIANCVAIREYNHAMDRCTSYYILGAVFGETLHEAVSKGPIILGNDVWIGTQCVILSGARIGTGAIIGANSVVTSEIPPYAIAVGSPARVIKSRFPEPMVARLLASEWWDWPRERILRNRPLFDGELTMEKLDAIRD